MGICFIFERVKNKVVRAYRKQVFREMIGCSHKEFRLVGDVTVINRNLKLGRNVSIYPGCMFWGDGVIEIGDNVSVGNGTIIYSSKSAGVKIGSNTMIAAGAYIIDMDHGTSRDMLIRDQSNTAEAVSIGEDCWLGANVTVLKGSKIGNGAVIGAKALVKGEVEPYSINVGIPAEVIRMRE